MNPRHVLVTGGAGFVGSGLALRARQAWPEATVTAFDNLRRRGSELNLARLRAAGVAFVHGDIRNPADLAPLGRDLDLLLECSAEPSVLAGYDGDPSYVIDTNLVGTIHCLELARKAGAAVLFLSTSRVYPIAALNDIRTEEAETRFDIADAQTLPGVSPQGISEDFPLGGTRSIYGATKLASELLIAEYHEAFGVRTFVNRCGVIAGPWQMGKVDQGVFSLWMARHLKGGTLTYNGWNGLGKQVRDLLHIDDLADLVVTQVERVRNARRPDVQCRRRPRVQPVAAGDHGGVRGDHRPADHDHAQSGHARRRHQALRDRQHSRDRGHRLGTCDARPPT